MAVNYRNYTPSDDVLQRLAWSRERASTMETRDVYCPYCHRRIAVVPVGDTGVIFPKCQKCKFNGPLDLRYFRRMKAYRNYYYDRPWKKPVR